MVWACFQWEDGRIRRLELYIIDRDFESKKHEYLAQSYIEVLNDQLPKCWQLGLIFIQDNAPIYMAYTVRSQFEDIAIPLLKWPPYSPDLNPIENVQWHLKKKVIELYPKLLDIGKGEDAKRALERALIKAQEALPDSLFKACLDSMPRRVEAVIKAEGWHIKY